MSEDFFVDAYSDAGDGRRIATRMADMLTEAVMDAVRVLAEDWLYAAQADVPIDTGYLMSTGRVAGPRIEGNDIVAEVGYGASYARYQHELNPMHDQWLARSGVLLAGSAETRLSRLLAASLPPGTQSSDD